ncbi:autotransporter outer membrane beta-barrel domain-containing protein [Snodgrassella sp. ESL0253]|uniref:autotransporter outer membrane beta-barrel domain-containing protein n=1 Tax=Snodgrassella sp. ESL0253 TaxID=2705031 RepID=UPI00158228C3|nr:autotransporter outer membrane beta-barrel domain-containing protein [Snodgrassella sp. ESL0253]NUE65743.1 autotransporter outer membrane beta-barrel domain-containing protein [Snodgrassella sp. ESL0253]
MNTIYKSKWSESTQTWVACSELARGKCKSNGLKIVAAVALALASTSVIAAPGSTSTITTPSAREQNHFHDSQGVYSEVNYKGMYTSTGKIIQNDSSNFDINIDGHYTIEGSITSTDTPNGEKAGILNIKNKHGIIKGNITNEGAGDITISNSQKISGAITSTQDSTGNITIDNNKRGSLPNNDNDHERVIDGDIINKGQGTFTIDNTSGLKGTIQNEGAGTITLDNKGASTSNINNTGAGTITLNNKGTTIGNIINKSDSASSEIEVTNMADTMFESTISNTKAGKIKLTNHGTTTRDITNSGYEHSRIEIINEANALLRSDINNTGAGLITLDNKGTSASNINNTSAGTITLDNKGASIGDINNTGAGTIILDNKGASTSDINNTGAGTITLNNKGTTIGNIINKSDSASSEIEVTNMADTMFESTISNTKAGKIKLTNHGTTTRDITNSGYEHSRIEIINEADALLGSDIKNTGAGIITLDNKGTSASNINNTSAGTITLDNKGASIGDINNTGAGTIILDNKGASTSDINNTGAGTITLDNKGTTIGNIINKSDSASSEIEVTNMADTMFESTISNTKAGKIKLTNHGTTTRDITNSGYEHSRIEIINEANALLGSDIKNTGAGIITLDNKGTSTGDINNTGVGTITLDNKGISIATIKNTNSGTITAINTGTFTGTTNNSGANGKIDLNNQGKWINTGSSTLSQLTNTGIIEFPQITVAEARDSNKYHTITVQGDYTGGGMIYVNTLWNDDSISKNGTGYTDRVNIEGNVTGGVTTVTTKKGIYGDITQKEIPITHPKTVIHVDGKIDGQGFGGKSTTMNAGEAQLIKIDQSLYGRTGTDYAWTLTAKIPADPAKPIKPTPPKEVPIYAEPVSGYVQMPTADMELGFTTIGTLHERRDENQTYNITGNNNTALGDKQQQTWGRVLIKHLDKNGKQRLDTVGNQSVLQIGHDFILDENNKSGTRRHIGAYVSYGHNENDFRDQYRAENGYVVDDHYTGKGRTDAVSVGGYGTFYANNGGYVDLVGQVSYLRNKYNARSNESVHQNGWGAAVSAEAGKSFTVYGNNWFVEPQAQLAYQYLSLDNFNDGIRHIDQHNPSALRGRVGMRFGYNGVTTDNLPPSSFYGITNIWHDFVNPKSVDIGRDSLKEEYAKTWGEVGVGIQLPITRQSHFYGDVRYEKNFGSAKHKGFKGTLGYKYTWL